LLLFYDKGGIDVGDVDSKAQKFLIPTNTPFDVIANKLSAQLLSAITDMAKRAVLVDFIRRLYTVYADLNFTYLEINPLVVLDPTPSSPSPQVIYLDLAARLDQTADFESGKYWSRAITPDGQTLRSIEFPAPFGRELTREEQYIADLDAKTGASLKLTVLNPQGRVWTMVAGGGASVVYR
jgi:ATP citrate (pro-S)-lyase